MVFNNFKYTYLTPVHFQGLNKHKRHNTQETDAVHSHNQMQHFIHSSLLASMTKPSYANVGGVYLHSGG